MRSRVRNVGIVASVSLPVLVILFGVFRGEQHVAEGTEWCFDVTGFDPRDLIHGHYINYRIDFHLDEQATTCAPGAEGCCYCLQQATVAGAPPQVSTLSCDAARTRCDGALDMRYLDHLHRYYVPEERAREVEQRLREAASDGLAQAVVSIDPSGRPLLLRLTVDGVGLLP